VSIQRDFDGVARILLRENTQLKVYFAIVICHIPPRLDVPQEVRRIQNYKKYSTALK
jgi:hypothetical protein